jgi:hypothetical protein
MKPRKIGEARRVLNDLNDLNVLNDPNALNALNALNVLDDLANYRRAQAKLALGEIKSVEDLKRKIGKGTLRYSIEFHAEIMKLMEKKLPNLTKSATDLKDLLALMQYDSHYTMGYGLETFLRAVIKKQPSVIKTVDNLVEALSDLGFEDEFSATSRASFLLSNRVCVMAFFILNAGNGKSPLINSASALNEAIRAVKRHCPYKAEMIPLCQSQKRLKRLIPNASALCQALAGLKDKEYSDGVIEGRAEAVCLLRSLGRSHLKRVLKTATSEDGLGKYYNALLESYRQIRKTDEGDREFLGSRLFQCSQISLKRKEEAVRQLKRGEEVTDPRAIENGLLGLIVSVATPPGSQPTESPRGH